VRAVAEDVAVAVVKAVANSADVERAVETSVVESAAVELRAAAVDVARVVVVAVKAVDAVAVANPAPTSPTPALSPAWAHKSPKDPSGKQYMAPSAAMPDFKAHWLVCR